jgi:hypothetical protein
MRKLSTVFSMILIVHACVATEEGGSLVQPYPNVKTNNLHTFWKTHGWPAVDKRALVEEEYTYMIDRLGGKVSSIDGLVTVNKLGQLDQDDFIWREYFVDQHYSILTSGIDEVVGSKSIIVAGQKNLKILAPGALHQYGEFSLMKPVEVSWKLYGGTGSLPKELQLSFWSRSHGNIIVD